MPRAILARVQAPPGYTIVPLELIERSDELCSRPGCTRWAVAGEEHARHFDRDDECLVHSLETAKQKRRSIFGSVLSERAATILQNGGKLHDPAPKSKGGRPRGTPPHGTRTRYQKPHRCRCQRCSDANRTYQRSWWKQHRAQAREPEDIPHGSTTGYCHHGCRCKWCTAANAVRGSRDYRRRRALGLPK